MMVFGRANDTGCVVFSSPLLFSRWLVQLCSAMGTAPSPPALYTQGVRELTECSCCPGFGHASLSVAMPWQESPLAHHRSSRARQLFLAIEKIAGTPSCVQLIGGIGCVQS